MVGHIACANEGCFMGPGGVRQESNAPAVSSSALRDVFFFGLSCSSTHTTTELQTSHHHSINHHPFGALFVRFMFQAVFLYVCFFLKKVMTSQTFKQTLSKHACALLVKRLGMPSFQNENIQ